MLYAGAVVQHQDRQHLHALFTTGHAVGLALLALLLLLALVELLLAEALLGPVLVGLDLLGQLELTVDLCVYLLLKFTHLVKTIRRSYINLHQQFGRLTPSDFMKVKSSPSLNYPTQENSLPLPPVSPFSHHLEDQHITPGRAEKNKQQQIDHVFLHFKKL